MKKLINKTIFSPFIQHTKIPDINFLWYLFYFIFILNNILKAIVAYSLQRE